MVAKTKQTKPAKPEVGFSKLSALEVSRAFGVVNSTVYQWHREGCPRNADKTYDLPTVVKWRIDRIRKAADEIEEGTGSKWLERKRRADAKMAEDKLRTERGKLCRIEDAEEELIKMAVSIRARLLGLPRSLADQLIGITRQVEAEAILMAAIRDSLTLISRGNLGPRAEAIIDKAVAEILAIGDVTLTAKGKGKGDRGDTGHGSGDTKPAATDDAKPARGQRKTGRRVAKGN